MHSWQLHDDDEDGAGAGAQGADPRDHLRGAGAIVMS
jgi:hypothetical protein